MTSSPRAVSGGRSVAVVPEPPPVLWQGLADAVSAVAPARSPATATPEELLAAAHHVVDRVLRAGCTSRTTALDLLVVDALVTYAFEQASDEPARLETRAAEAMRALASLPMAASSGTAT